MATFVGGLVIWHDGTVWYPAASPSPEIVLTDYTNAKGVAVHAIRNGTANVAFSDSLGHLSLGTFINPTQATDNDYPGDMATFTATTVNWQLGAIWTSTANPPITVTAIDANSVGSHVALISRTLLVGLDGPLQGIGGTRLNGRILWSNGQIWDDFDLNALNAFIEMGMTYP